MPTGVCSTCRGQKRFNIVSQPCATCTGRGRRENGPCPACRGQQKVTIPQYIACRTCGGTGLVEYPDHR